MNKQTKIIIALGVTLIVVFGVIAFNYWNNYQEQKDLEIYNQGINDAVIAIINEVKTNNYVQLPDGNKSIILTQYTGEAQ